MNIQKCVRSMYWVLVMVAFGGGLLIVPSAMFGSVTYFEPVFVTSNPWLRSQEIPEQVEKRTLTPSKINQFDLWKKSVGVPSGNLSATEGQSITSPNWRQINPLKILLLADNPDPDRWSQDSIYGYVHVIYTDNQSLLKDPQTYRDLGQGYDEASQNAAAVATLFTHLLTVKVYKDASGTTTNIVTSADVSANMKQLGVMLTGLVNPLAWAKAATLSPWRLSVSLYRAHLPARIFLDISNEYEYKFNTDGLDTQLDTEPPMTVYDAQNPRHNVPDNSFDNWNYLNEYDWSLNNRKLASRDLDWLNGRWHWIQDQTNPTPNYYMSDPVFTTEGFNIYSARHSGISGALCFIVFSMDEPKLNGPYRAKFVYQLITQ